MAPTATIILVDAQAERRRKLTESLASAKVKLTPAETVEQAVDAARGSPADLLLHACDNLAALPSIRRLKLSLPGCPLLVYTENFREITRLRTMEIGADEMVQIEVLGREIEPFLPPLTTGTEKGGPAAPASTKGQMYLQLNAGEISNALQFLCMTSRHGQLVLTFGDETKGVVFLKGNTIVHAEYRGKSGTEAIALMLSQGETEALFLEGMDAQTETIQMPLSQILLEASVLADELSAQSRQ
jgi:DNA-binding response OmpR family regulator